MGTTEVRAHNSGASLLASMNIILMLYQHLGLWSDFLLLVNINILKTSVLRHSVYDLWDSCSTVGVLSGSTCDGQTCLVMWQF